MASPFFVRSKHSLCVVILMMLFSSACMAEDFSITEEKVICDEYTYMLPKGFEERSIKQGVYPDGYSQIVISKDVTSKQPPPRTVTCITKENTKNVSYILESANSVVSSYLDVKAPRLVTLTRYEGDNIPKDMRLYTVGYTSFVVEIDSRDRKNNVLIYVRDSIDFTNADFEKIFQNTVQHAKHFMASIQAAQRK